MLDRPALDRSTKRTIGDGSVSLVGLGEVVADLDVVALGEPVDVDPGELLLLEEIELVDDLVLEPLELRLTDLDLLFLRLSILFLGGRRFGLGEVGDSGRRVGYGRFFSCCGSGGLDDGWVLLISGGGSRRLGGLACSLRPLGVGSLHLALV